MIATGTDIKPLEVLLFLRDVRSRVYFEQMKGRGTRVLTVCKMQAVSAKTIVVKIAPKAPFNHPAAEDRSFDGALDYFAVQTQ